MIDARTAVLLGSLNGLLVAVCFFVGRSSREGAFRRSMRLWAVSMAVESLGWICSALRGTIPELAAVVLGNGCTTLAVAGIGDAIRILFGVRRRVALRYGIPLLWVAGLVPLTWPRSYFHLRVVLVSLASAVQILEAVWPVLARTRSRETRLASDVLVGLLFAVGALLFLTRFVVEATRLEAIAALFVTTPLESLIFLYVAILSTVGSVGFLSMCNDRYHLELVRLAATDPLTELANRRGLREHGERVLLHGRRTGASTALVVLDVDHFKRINDRFGHDVGDSVLVAVAQRLRRAVRGHDVLARAGGEEFMVVLVDATESEAAVAAERLRAAVESNPESLPVAVTVSAGVAAVTGPATTLEDLFRRADQALYRAKELGRNQVVVASRLEEPDAALGVVSEPASE